MLQSHYFESDVTPTTQNAIFAWRIQPPEMCFPNGCHFACSCPTRQHFVFICVYIFTAPSYRCLKFRAQELEGIWPNMTGIASFFHGSTHV